MVIYDIKVLEVYVQKSICFTTYNFKCPTIRLSSLTIHGQTCQCVYLKDYPATSIYQMVMTGIEP